MTEPLSERVLAAAIRERIALQIYAVWRKGRIDVTPYQARAFTETAREYADAVLLILAEKGRAASDADVRTRLTTAVARALAATRTPQRHERTREVVDAVMALVVADRQALTTQHEQDIKDAYNAGYGAARLLDKREREMVQQALTTQIKARLESEASWVDPQLRHDLVVLVEGLAPTSEQPDA